MSKNNVKYVDIKDVIAKNLKRIADHEKGQKK